VDNIPTQEIKSLHEGIVEGFEMNFIEERTEDYNWRQLAVPTQVKRSKHGFDPMHPILEMYGGYKRSWLQRGGDHVEKITRSSGGVKYNVGSQHWMLPIHEEGRYADIPARPVRFHRYTNLFLQIPLLQMIQRVARTLMSGPDTAPTSWGRMFSSNAAASAKSWGFVWSVSMIPGSEMIFTQNLASPLDSPGSVW
jgi:hypothetical protein